jgi:hypothetical protein
MQYVIIGILLVAVIVAAVVIQKQAGEARARVEAGLAPLDVRRQDLKADFYGQTSKGEGQVRSKGALALTADELVFFGAVPAAEVRIPRPAITEVELARAFLGKTLNRDLLVVAWRTGDGDDTHDRAAFDVADADDWRADLKPAGSATPEP